MTTAPEVPPEVPSEEQLAARYRREAETAAARSPLRAEIAAGIAGDPEIVGWLCSLPAIKQQPILLFGVLRYLYDTPDGWGSARELLRSHRATVEETILSRRTQVNEAGRCATLLPLLARLPQPLALLEVGASGGLCLLPDRYAYTYGDHRLPAAVDVGVEPPVLPCVAGAGTPLPAQSVQVAWRAGLDLAPIDITSDEQVRWLEALVWPDAGGRLERLRAAIQVARRDPPRIVQGDLTIDLPTLAAEAPAEATLVVYHSGVLGYVEPEGREQFSQAVAALPCTWISNETARTLPAIAGPLAGDARRRFLLAQDRQPLAWASMTGTVLHWLDGAAG